jgi:hypothetical protein
MTEQLLMFIGIFSFLLIFFIITIILMLKWMSKNFNDIRKNTLLLKNNIPDPQQESIEKFLLLNTDIKDCLKNLIVDLDADWGQLWQFHNGIHGLGAVRIPFMFLAITHEVCKNPEDKTLSTFAQLPLSIYGEFITKMKSKDVLIFQEFLDKNSPVYQLVSSAGARSGFFRTIRDRDDQIIGFISILWKADFISTGSNKLKFINGCQRMAAVLSSTSGKE